MNEFILLLHHQQCNNNFDGYQDLYKTLTLSTNPSGSHLEKHLTTYNCL